MSKRLLFSGIAALSLAGCVNLAPDYQRPASDLPEAWGVAPNPSLTAASVGGDWWKLFGDTRLDALVAEALQRNANVALAIARVDEARAQVGLTDADRFPVVGAEFSRSRNRISGVTGTPLPPGVPLETNNYRAAVNVSYELDLWGRLRNASAAARAELLASEAARETVRTTLAADVVQGWYNLRALEQQLADTRRSLVTRNEGLALQQRRYDAGMISQFELSQLGSEVAAAQAQLPVLERRRRQQETALAVLSGRSPRDIYATGGASTVPPQPGAGAPAGEANAPLVVPSGLPSELLLRRPDIVQAEQRMIAANARIGQARAAVFPSISLTGFLGSQSAALSNLFSGPAAVWSLAAAVAQPIFSGGRQQAGIAGTEARERQALAQYQLAVQTAFKEVRDALDGLIASREQLEAEGRRAESLRDALRLARLRYENGIASQLDVLDAERNLLAAELNVAEARRAQRAAIADLFKALGGGW